jgi:hypothetical protein
MDRLVKAMGSPPGHLKQYLAGLGETKESYSTQLDITIMASLQDPNALLDDTLYASPILIFRFLIRG